MLPLGVHILILSVHILILSVHILILSVQLLVGGGRVLTLGRGATGDAQEFAAARNAMRVILILSVHRDANLNL